MKNTSICRSVDFRINLNAWIRLAYFCWYIGILTYFQWVKIQYFFLNFWLWNTIKCEIFIWVFTFFATMLGWLLNCSIDLVIGSSTWSIFTDSARYFGIFRFGTTLIKKLWWTSATFWFLSKIKSCSTNEVLLWVTILSY